MVIKSGTESKYIELKNFLISKLYNFKFLMLFFLIFSFAFFIASSIISTPITSESLNFLAIN